MEEALEFLNQFDLPEFNIKFTDSKLTYPTQGQLVFYQDNKSYDIYIDEKIKTGDFVFDENFENGNETDKLIINFFNELNLKFTKENFLLFIIFHEIGHIIDVEELGSIKIKNFDYEKNANNHAKKLFKQYIKEGYLD